MTNYLIDRTILTPSDSPEVETTHYAGKGGTVDDTFEVVIDNSRLLVNCFEESPWLELPDVLRTMVPAGYTTPQGTDGWASGGTEYASHSRRQSTYDLNGPVFNPIPTYDDLSAWNCVHSHGWAAESGSTYFNTPPTSSSWGGSATCEAPHGPTIVAGVAPAGFDNVTWNVYTYASGGADRISIASRSLAVWMNLSAIKSGTLAGNIASPSGGLPYPVPPPGKTLVWQNPTSTLKKIETAISEPIVNSNTGTVYMLKRNPGDGKYGPVDPTGASMNWTEGNADSGGSVVPGYSGGECPWSDVTSEINETGRTWFLLENEMLHDHLFVHGTNPLNEMRSRSNLVAAFRFSIRPSRYKFV